MARKEKATHTCCARVYSRGFIDMRGHACGVGARHEVNGKWFCKTHSPAVKKEKHDKAMNDRAEKWARRDAARDRRDRRLKRNERSWEIIRQIAEGHNDPRKIAWDLLKEYADAE